MKRLLIALSIGLLYALLAMAPAGAADSITVTLTPQNNSGESGTATLTAMGDQTKVVLDLTGGPANAQPNHIHEGTCANLNPKPKYPLTNLENGKGETVVPVSLSALMSSQFAINVHKSAEEASTYYACGDIPMAGTVLPATGHPQTSQSGTSMVAGSLALLGLVGLGGGLIMRRRTAR